MYALKDMIGMRNFLGAWVVCGWVGGTGLRECPAYSTTQSERLVTLSKVSFQKMMPVNSV